MAAAGSWITNTLDEHSDVDLVVAVSPAAVAEVTAERPAILARLGPLLTAFTGEHVGEPRLMIALYGPPLLHVDVKFVSADDLAVRVEDPVILWERDGAFSRAFAASAPAWPRPSWQWIEDRFWVWVHYGATKIARGELFEAEAFLSFLRMTALGPLASLAAGLPARGVRHVERDLPAFAEELRATVATADRAQLWSALRATVGIYGRLRESSAPTSLVRRREAEDAVVAYLAATSDRG